MSDTFNHYLNTNKALAVEGAVRFSKDCGWVATLGFEIHPNNGITLRTFAHIAGRRVEFDLPTRKELNGAKEVKITVEIIE